MNILHLYKDYFPVVGGIENHIKWLAEAQAAHGHTVSVLVTSRDCRTHVEMLNGVRVIFAARLATLSSAPISVALPRLLAREQPDIAHLHFPYPWGETSHYFFNRARKTVLTYHSDIIRQKNLLRLYQPLLTRVLRRADRIIVTSPRYLETSPFLTIVREKSRSVPYGIDPMRFASADPSRVAEIRAQYASPLVLFVGQLRYYKGVEYLIRAMAKVRGNAILIGGETTTQIAELKKIARTVGVNDRIFFLGERVEELPAFFQACDVFALPSVERSEAFGIVQLEAMAAGKPVVCTELGTGTSYVNVDGETGFVVPARDVDAFATALSRLIGDPELRARLGARGRARVHREFTLEKMVERVMEVYEETLER